MYRIINSLVVLYFLSARVLCQIDPNSKIVEPSVEVVDPSGSLSTIIGLLDISQDPNDVAFHLYPNKEDLNDTDLLVHGNPDSIKSSRFNTSNGVILLTHGFTQTSMSQFPYYLKKAYLDADYHLNKANIIAVDWGKLSGQYDTSGMTAGILAFAPAYQTARLNVFVVGKRVQEFLDFLIKNGFLSGPDKVHLVGQSLGAHVSGMAGSYYLNETGSLLGRITGTDPAGPLFQFFPTDSRLDESDAKFVDIVHTNEGQLGYLGNLGHVDFHINSGGPLPQPGCRSTSPVEDMYCSHNSAPRYFAKSIQDSTILGSVPLLAYVTSYFSTTEIFGEHCPPTARGSYYVSMTMD